MPTNEATRQVSDILVGTAQDEDLALRQLRGTFEKSVAEGDGVTFRPLDPTLFDAFDAQLVASNTLRLQAGQALADVLNAISQETSEETKADAEEFAARLSALLKDWDEFHQDYDNWLKTEGRLRPVPGFRDARRLHNWIREDRRESQGLAWGDFSETFGRAARRGRREGRAGP